MATDYRTRDFMRGGGDRTFAPGYDWEAGMGGAIAPRTRKAIWAGLALAAAAPPVLLFALSPFSPALTVKHQMARLGCPMATSLGLAPAEAGAPGYHAPLDEDGDGVACETARPRSGPFGRG